MNHDYCHCLDYDETCPKQCFRSQLMEDLKGRKDLNGVPLTYSHLKGTSSCLLTMKQEQVDVIKCKYCIYYYEASEVDGFCRLLYDENGYWMYTQNDCFCCWGELE